MSKEFDKYKDSIPSGHPPMQVDIENIPEEFRNLGVPVLPPDFSVEPKIPKGFEGGKVTINGIKGLRVTRENVSRKYVNMHIHGGGFTVGSAMDNGELLAYLTEKTGLESYSVEYRLAPYHKHPAALEDCIAFYQGLFDKGYKGIVVGGESAGGTLTLSLVLALKERKMPLPAVIWCSSPACDQNYDKHELFKDDMFSSTAEAVRKVYAGDADPDDPLISPLNGDLSGFPPMYIQAGTEESLSASIVKFVEKACKAGNEVQFLFGKGMPHTFAMDYKVYPEAKYAMNSFTEFINYHLTLLDEN